MVAIGSADDFCDLSIVDELALTSCANISELKLIYLPAVDHYSHITLVGTILLSHVVDDHILNRSALPHVDGFNRSVLFNTVNVLDHEILHRYIIQKKEKN